MSLVTVAVTIVLPLLAAAVSVILVVGAALAAAVLLRALAALRNGRVPARGPAAAGLLA